MSHYEDLSEKICLLEILEFAVTAVAMSSHLGRTSTYQKVSSRFYWYTIVNDVADYIKG